MPTILPDADRRFLNNLTPAAQYLTRTASVLPQTASVTFYTVTGLVLIYANLLEVTTVIQAQANAIKWRHTPSGGAIGDVSGTFDVNAAAVGDFVVMQGPTDAGAVSQAMTSLAATTGATGLTLLARPILLRGGALALNAAASSTGAVKGHLVWAPLFPGQGTVTPA